MTRPMDLWTALLTQGPHLSATRSPIDNRWTTKGCPTIANRSAAAHKLHRLLLRLRDINLNPDPHGYASVDPSAQKSPETG